MGKVILVIESSHIDIKPENILLHTHAIFPRLIIADLGDATTYDAILKTVPKVQVGMTVRRKYDYFGTVQYAPPEILEGRNTGRKSDGSEGFRAEIAQEWVESDKAVDMWALGSTYPVKSCILMTSRAVDDSGRQTSIRNYFLGASEEKGQIADRQ